MTKEKVLESINNHTIEVDIQGHGRVFVLTETWFDKVAEELASDGDLVDVSGCHYCRNHCQCEEPDRESGFSYCHKCHLHVSDERIDELIAKEEAEDDNR